MCGRFTVGLRGEALWEQLGLFDGSVVDFAWEPRFNVAPTQRAPVIGQRRGRPPRPVLMRWGLVPEWSKDGRPFINARSETAADKPAFRDAMRSRRCLIPVDGFYEWKRVFEGGNAAHKKRAVHIRRPDRSPFLLAGLWGVRRVEGARLFEFTVLTRDATGAIADLHDRMPCVVAGESVERWLNPDAHDPRALTSVLTQPPPTFVLDPVGAAVNNVANDDARCLEAPVPELFPGLA